MSARRQARAAAAPVEVEGKPPTELYDADAAVWHDGVRYAAFMISREWLMPPSERVGVGTHPANRRNYAADAWGMANGVGNASGADWHHLRAMGLIAGTTSLAAGRGA